MSAILKKNWAISQEFKKLDDEHSTSRPQGKNRECPFLRIFVYSPCSLGKMIKLSINQRCKGKTVRFLNNQQLKYPIQLKNRESLNLVFLISQFLKKQTFPIFPLGASIVSNL